MTSVFNDSFLSIGDCDKSELDIELELCEELLENEMSDEGVCLTEFSRESNEALSDENSTELSVDGTECVSSKLDNSELDIELELCEELFEEERCSEVMCKSQELPIGSNEMMSVDNANELTSKYNEIVCINNYNKLNNADKKLENEINDKSVYSRELSFKNNEILSDNSSNELSSKDNECVDNSNKLNIGELDIKLKLLEKEVCDSHKLPFESNEMSVDNSNELPFETKEVLSSNFKELTSEHNECVSSKLDNSELDIELELCEELFEKERCSEVMCNSQELPFENNEMSIDNSNELPSKYNEIKCVNNSNKLNSSQLDIELELCEELLEKEMCNEVECNSQELPSKNNEVVCINNFHDLPSDSNVLDNIGLDCDIKKCYDISKFDKQSDSDNLLSESDIESEFKHKAEVLTEKTISGSNFEDGDAISLFVDSDSLEDFELLKSNEAACINNSHDLPSDSNILDKDGLDSEVKKYCDISKFDKPSQPKNILCESDIKSEFEHNSVKIYCDILKFDKPSQPNNILCESDIKSEFEHNSEVLTEQMNYDSNLKDSDEISLYAPNDISTLEEFETSILECTNTSLVAQDIDEEEEIIVDETDDSNEDKDIYDPRWELVKQLSTEEEWYTHVRNLWKCSIVLDPNRNLTYHSYRKRHFKNLKPKPKSRKRAATSNLDDSRLNPAKRQRSCTFKLDQQLDSLSAEKDKRNKKLFNKMHSEVQKLNNIFAQQEQKLQMQRQYEYNGSHTYNSYVHLFNLREQFKTEVEGVQQQFVEKANQSAAELQHQIHVLNSARDEVLNFYKFYKGSNSKDPTVLTTSQLQELDEIENLHSVFENMYKG